MFSKEIQELAKVIVERCDAAGLTLTTAESCTGGLIAAAITDVPGASRVFGRGVVTYANEAKTDLLGVPEALVGARGAVDEDVCRAMAEGALARAGADLAVAVTGIAGPGGGSADKPVGLVHIATARRGGAIRHRRCQFSGNRDAVRSQTVAAALEMLRAEIA